MYLLNRSNQEYVMHLNNGDIVKAKVDTCFDTDNGLDIDEEGYEEYYACAIEILEILEDNTGTLKVGMLMEINYHNWPKKIIDEKGNIV